MYKVELIWGDERKTFMADSGENLLKLLKREGMEISSPCGGKCFCGKCKIQIIEGSHALKSCLPGEIDLLTSLERQKGFRLACAVTIEEDLIIRYGTGKREEAVILLDGRATDSELAPAVEKKYMELEPPSIQDQRSDEERVGDALGLHAKFSRDLMVKLPSVLREGQYQVTAALFDDEVIDMETGNTSGKKYGIAVDIGTTTIAGYLMDLTNGAQVDTYSALNPQRAYGADVITRTDYTIENEKGLAFLAALVQKELGQMVSYFRENNAIDAQDIYHMTVVGNTIMMHILAGIPVKHIAVSPFIPVYSRGFSLDAALLNISIHPHGKVSLLPCVAGYVGADTIGAIMASGMDEEEGISLLIDIGTNGEIALGSKEGIVCCSTAAGPAFEGAHIRCGLGGVKGAISKVRMDEILYWETIGGEAARGICGSGIVDAVSQMKNAGIIDTMGKILSPSELDALGERIRDVDGKPAFLIASIEEGAAEDVYICQKDLREVQLAKGAIAAGVRILMKEMGISFEHISHVYLAGGFGNYIDYESACNIGLLPLELREKLASIGNGAGIGAKMSLLSKANMDRSERIRKMTQYVELSSRIDFQELFVDMLMF